MTSRRAADTTTTTHGDLTWGLTRLERGGRRAAEAQLGKVYAALAHTHTLASVTDSGGAAALEVGTTAGTVAAGDHTHAGGGASKYVSYSTQIEGLFTGTGTGANGLDSSIVIVPFDCNLVRVAAYVQGNDLLPPWNTGGANDTNLTVLVMKADPTDDGPLAPTFLHAFPVVPDGAYTHATTPSVALTAGDAIFVRAASVAPDFSLTSVAGQTATFTLDLEE